MIVPANLPTLEDVARRAGVSRGTASNVFNHPDRVRPELRERVADAARDLGYAGPDPRGQLLRRGPVNAIGFAIPGEFGIANLLLSPYGRELVAGMASACDLAGMSLTLVDGQARQLGVAMRQAVVDGFIIGNSGDRELIESASQRRLPFVAIDVPPDPAIDTISIAARDGAYAAARHLIELGHQRLVIASVRRTRGGPIAHPPGPGRRLSDGIELDHEKLDGYARAMADAGLSLDRMPIVETLPSDPEAGAAIFEQAPEATAVLAMSDRQALTILAEAQRRGIAVPGDLSIVGFDGVPEAALTTPPLTTVAQPVREKGRLAAQMLIDGGAPRQLTLPTELIVRGSTGPASRRRRTTVSRPVP